MVQQIPASVLKINNKMKLVETPEVVTDVDSVPACRNLLKLTNNKARQDKAKF